MRVAIVHNAVGAAAGPDERDVLTQVEHVAHALADLGHRVSTIPCTLDLEALRTELTAKRPEVVFNLVESLAGRDRLLPVVPSLLAVLGLPHTGCSATALFLSTSKLLTKERLLAAGLPAPPALAAWPEEVPVPTDPWPARVIVKSVWDHGSLALDDRSVIPLPDPIAHPGLDRHAVLAELRAQLSTRAPQLGGECLAEAYIEGREFNLSVLATPDGPLVLPAAEIEFVGFPVGKPRILGHQAKWHPGTFEYDQTQRRLAFAAHDQPLLQQLAALARRSWECFRLDGYARIDFRVDLQGQPWILEVNANPCLSPDAGFAAALAAHGTSFTQAIAQILAAACHPRLH